MKNNRRAIVILLKALITAFIFFDNCYGYGLLPLDDSTPDNPFFEIKSGFWTYVCDISPECQQKDRMLLNNLGFGAKYYFESCYIDGGTSNLDDPVRCRRVTDITVATKDQPLPSDVRTFMDGGSIQLCSKCSPNVRPNEGWSRGFYWHCRCSNQCRLMTPSYLEEQVVQITPTLQNYKDIPCPSSDNMGKCDCPIKWTRWSRNDSVTRCHGPIYTGCPNMGAFSDIPGVTF